MKVKTLKKYLADVPDNFDIDFSKMFIVVGKKEKDKFECILDHPIYGIALHNKAKHVRFMLYSEQMKTRDYKMFSRDMGKVRKLK